MRILWTFLLLPAVFSEFGINKKCITPHGDIGTCKELTSCHLFHTHRNLLNNVSVKKYLRQSYCGTRYNMALICCGPEGRNLFQECGLMDKYKPKIYGGEVTKTHFPWMVAIQYREHNEVPVFKCQGFLINQHFVLTAAHCLRFQKVHAVILGVSNLTDYDQQESYKKARVLNISYHEDYVKDIDDIGLIRIKPVEYTDKIRWICLPRKNATLPDWYTIRGWGKNDKQIKVFSAAIESRIRSAAPSNCRFVNSRNISWNRVICAGGEPNKDSCDGDSGGALMNDTADFGWTAFGIVSFGSRNCSRGDPGVYTRIQYYLEWLDRKMMEMLEQ
ncbi:chymotrypsin-C-like isoform X1 [Coccinella septempunctata]|uniref:chymotrypsin-C-like isoform X1 n=1 Tax=Coccinella septempunctata TaxID=41139 RepID=UPI001D08DB7C|nr:chymotrypsin-C-like isoform X1 [Coccinella septempunctata]